MFQILANKRQWCRFLCFIKNAVNEAYLHPMCKYTKTSEALCDPGCDFSPRDTRFLLSRGYCAATKPRLQCEFCAAWVQGDAQQLKLGKMAPGMLRSSCYCWLIGIWEVGKVILNVKNGTLKKQLLVLSSEWPRQQKGFPFWNEQHNLHLSLCKLKPVLAFVTPPTRTGLGYVMALFWNRYWIHNSAMERAFWADCSPPRSHSI